MRYAWLLLALAACGEEEPAGSTTGTLTLRFSVTNTVRTSGNLSDELQGSVYGAIFLAIDIGGTGPRNGAQPVVNVEIADVDLRTADESTASWRADLPPERYGFLGFLDVDGNVATTGTEPDAGDPVTLPKSNEWSVVAGAEESDVAVFDLVYF
jgi:hypothetical protein